MMDEFNNLQFLLDEDDKILSEVCCSFSDDWPSFNVNNEENTPMTATSVPCVQESEKLPSVSPNHEALIDQSRFPAVPQDVIEDMKENTVNSNTKRTTKTWMKVVEKWCQARNMDAKIEKLSPQELDKMLNKFYAEVKKQDGEDYEPESLRVMQAAIDRYLKEKNYPCSIIRSREFHNSRETLNAVAVTLRQQGKGKRPHKAKPLNNEDEEQLWKSGQLGSHNGRALTQTNFKMLTEQLGLRGRQEHYDSYVEDFVIIFHQDGSESVEFSESPTKTRSGGLRIRHRKTPQIMYSTDGGERDPVRLFKLWLSKRPEGMKDNGPLYLSIINRPKCPDIWYGKIRMGENSIGNLMKSMAQFLCTDKKLTNHSMRKTLVQKLKKSGQSRHVIKEITGHARESSLDDYDEVDEDERRKISHIISGFNTSNTKSLSNLSSELSAQSTCNNHPFHGQALAVAQQISKPQLLDNSLQTTLPFQSSFQASFPSMPQNQLTSSQTAVLNTSCHQSSTAPAFNYSHCTFNIYNAEMTNALPRSPQVHKRRRRVIFDSDDEKEN